MVDMPAATCDMCNKWINCMSSQNHEIIGARLLFHPELNLKLPSASVFRENWVTFLCFGNVTQKTKKYWKPKLERRYFTEIQNFCWFVWSIYFASWTTFDLGPLFYVHILLGVRSRSIRTLLENFPWRKNVLFSYDLDKNVDTSIFF
jgi:hypothetical protein